MSIRAKWLGVMMLLSGVAPICHADEYPLPPDIALLEFLGTTAGLEALGVNIDQLLSQSQSPNLNTSTTPQSLQPRIKNDENN